MSWFLNLQYGHAAAIFIACGLVVIMLFAGWHAVNLKRREREFSPLKYGLDALGEVAKNRS